MEQRRDEMTDCTSRPYISEQPYVYETLLPGEIRILVLSPGQADEPLRARLQTVSRSEEPAYKAISYTWGDPVFPHVLQLPEGRVFITESLFGALRRFRGETDPVRLWADAVCINQDGIQEKNHQVADMHKIFEQAEEVLVWLGEAQETDCLISYYLEKLGTLSYSMEKRVQQVWQFHTEIMHRVEWGTCGHCGSEFNIIGGDKLIDALLAFWSRPWFWRLWVIQEIYCAKSYTLHFGQHSISSCIAGKAYESQRMYPGIGIAQSMYDRQRAKLNKLSWSTSLELSTPNFQTRKGACLLDVVFNTQYAICSIPQDRVFAIRRLANLDTLDLLIPDYRMSVKDLWVRAATVELTLPSTWALDDMCDRSPILVLAVAGVQRKFDNAEEPAWVPDLGNLSAECIRKSNFHRRFSRQSLAGGRCGRRDITTEVDEETPRLRIRGRWISRVEKVYMNTQYRTEFHEGPKGETKDAFWTRITENLFPWYSKCVDLVIPRTYLDTYAFHTLLGLMFHHDGFYRRYDESRYAAKDDFTQAFERWEKTTCATIHPSMDLVFIQNVLWTLFQESDHFSEYVDRTRVLAYTLAGQVGWIPEASEPGDVVVLFQDSPFPFILRERPDGYYSVIGDAYIQGIMEGQAWPKDHETGVEWIGIK